MTQRCRPPRPPTPSRFTSAPGSVRTPPSTTARRSCFAMTSRLAERGLGGSSRCSTARRRASGRLGAEGSRSSATRCPSRGSQIGHRSDRAAAAGAPSCPSHASGSQFTTSDRHLHETPGIQGRGAQDMARYQFGSPSRGDHRWSSIVGPAFVPLVRRHRARCERACTVAAGRLRRRALMRQPRSVRTHTAR